jgi:hypothetical protein
MKRNLARILAGLALLPGAAAAQSSPPPLAKPEAAFQALRTLVGDWRSSTPKGPAYDISFRLVSADSVLVETYTTRSGRETLTLFHLDGPRLLATHYCAQGNQPRLRLAAATNRRFTFEFADATNLSEGGSHLHQLDLEILDADHAQETETYQSAGKSEATVLSLARKPRTDSTSRDAP